MPVYSLFYSWPKKILKCFSILPSLNFPQLWPEASLIDAQTLDLNSYLHKPNSFILLGHTSMADSTHSYQMYET